MDGHSTGSNSRSVQVVHVVPQQKKSSIQRELGKDLSGTTMAMAELRRVV
jgi:hypothetical protein